MREIKFRAWDKRDRVIRDVVGMSFYHDSVSVDIEHGRYLQDDVSRFELMQFTGLLDKNRKEIYEGDIIKLIFVNDDIFVSHLNGFINEPSEDDLIEIEYLTVYFNNRFGTYCISNIEKKKRVNEDEYFPDSSNILAVWNKECEVIGNIYENPEL